MTIMKDEPHGAIRIEVFLNPLTERFGLQIIDEGPHTLSPQEMEDVLSMALRNVAARRTITSA
ncbi:hypothetical protein OWR29_39515 [Actinoplanes sp. Pm04-4]|uniref:Uncharacterized protein n=1 Tax=Paractinoplanes pyxinae TaxID=2997416 RepID=A0ABT4BCB7_9ACTN|nr:hypothetical protein [Actinoplanes pyxinae]MCY1144121.1 hypothetical protein [Actinoplanes pyxinae]